MASTRQQEAESNDMEQTTNRTEVKDQVIKLEEWNIEL